MKTFNDFMTEAKRMGKKDYEIYHRMYSDAVGEAINLANKQGFEVDPDDLFNRVTTGPRKPSKGKTNSIKLGLLKNGKPVRKMLVFQVYGLENGGKNINGNHYELTAYVS